MKYWLRSCPRCRIGDLKEETDAFGRYIACLQCGCILSVVEEAQVLGARLEPAAKVAEQAAA